MAYSDFTLAKAKEMLGLTLLENTNLFSEVREAETSKLLQSILTQYTPLAIAINTEKSRSEFLIAPVLAELKWRLETQVSLFSGTDFNVDSKRGLQGYCDYILSRSSEQYFITAPVVTIIEAKKENIVSGLGQCAAAMVAAQIFNSRTNSGVELVYGSVTSGSIWKFLVLKDNILSIDSVEYYISQVNKILGILIKQVTNKD